MQSEFDGEKDYGTRTGKTIKIERGLRGSISSGCRGCYCANRTTRGTAAQKWGTWLSSTAACRVIDVIDDPATIRRVSNDHHDEESGFQFDSDTTFDRLGSPDRIDPIAGTGERETDDEKKSKAGDIDSVFRSCKFQFTRDANVHASVILFLRVTIETESDRECSLLDDRAINAREG